MKNIISLWAIVLLLLAVDSVSAQSVECLLPKIKLAIKDKAPAWNIEHSMTFDENVFVWLKMGEMWTNVEMKMLSSMEAAKKHFEREVSETNDFFEEANIGASKFSVNVGEVSDIWTGYYQGNSVLLFRKNNMYVKVEASSAITAQEFARLVADQIPAI